MSTHIREIPPDILFRLYSMLDVTGHRNNWQALAGHAGFRMEDINSFQRAQFSGESPTAQLLRVWGYQNATITELFQALAVMRHAQAMKLIKHLVDPKLHYMIENIQGEPLENKPADHRPPPSNYMAGPRLDPQSPSIPPDNGMPMVPGRLQPSVNYHGHDDHRLSNQRSVEPTNYYQSTQHSRYMPGYSAGSSPLSPGARLLSPGGPGQAFQHQDSRLYNNSTPFHHRPQEAPPASVEISRESREEMASAAAVTTTIHMEYEVIKKATNNFDEKCKLGEGSFGKVYLADINQTKYAVKLLLQNEKLQISVQNNRRSDQSKELKALSRYKHRNIVLMCFFSVDGEHPCIIYEYIENGSLEDNLLGKGDRPPLTWQQRHQIAEGSALGINHLHKASKTALIHGDIKSANILLDKHFEPKIADFGLARSGPTDGKSFTYLRTQFAHGTLPYLPEEFHRNLQLSPKVDSFSFGVVLMEMLTGQRAHCDTRKPHQLLSNYVADAIDNKTIPIQDLKDKKCADWPDEYFEKIIMLARALVRKFKQRPQMDEVLNSLKAIFYGEKVTEENAGAVSADQADPLTYLEGQRLSTKQEQAASPLPLEKHMLEKVKNISLMEDFPKLSHEEQQRQKSFQNFHRHGGMMSPEAQNNPVHSPSVSNESEPRYNNEKPSLVGPDPMHHAGLGTRANVPTWENSRRHPADMYTPDAYRPEMHHPQAGLESGFKHHNYHEAGRMPAASEAPFSGRYQDISSTTDSSNNPYSYTHRYLGGKETAVDRAYYEGFQVGFQRGFQEAVLQQTQLRGMHEGMEAAGRLYRPDQMPPDRSLGHPLSMQVGEAGPRSLLPHATGNMPKMNQGPPAMSHIPPSASLGYGIPGESRHMVSMDHHGNRSSFPHISNKTDDAKITTSGGELSETNSQEKSVAALQTKPISLDELRYHKEPQQSTEPI